MPPRIYGDHIELYRDEIGIAYRLECRVYDLRPNHGESEAKNAGCNSNWVLTGM